VPIYGRRCWSARQSQLNFAVGTERQPAERDLERRGGIRLAEQPGTEPECSSVGGPRRPDANSGVPHPPEILNEG
jgi:hypothetical protein